MAKKRDNIKWAIIDDSIVRLKILFKQEERYVGVSSDGKEHCVSKYDVYKTLHEATDVLNEELQL